MVTYERTCPDELPSSLHLRVFVVWHNDSGERTNPSPSATDAATSAQNGRARRGSGEKLDSQKVFIVIVQENNSSGNIIKKNKFKTSLKSDNKDKTDE